MRTAPLSHPATLPAARSTAAARRLGAALLVAAALAGCGGDRPAARSARPDGVLLVTLDTLRADHLGCYGGDAAVTPTLDRLAAGGTRFAQAMTAAPLTLPSHATILTGLLPPHHGLRQNGSGSLPENVPTLAGAFAAAGWRTAAFVGAFVLDRRFGLARDFAVYDDAVPRDPRRDRTLEAERRGDAVVDAALAWLGQDPGKPFFAWVHLYDAHAPYAPPSPWRERFANPYDGEIAFVDAQVGRLVDALSTAGRLERTLIVVVGDHGEALGDHGEATHGLLLYEPTLHVPWIVRGPGVPAGSTVAAPVSLADLAPTVAALAGVELAGGARRDGRDLAADLVARREPPRAELYAETEYPRLFGWSGLAALRRGDLKYVAAPRPELYDLAADPGEAKNLLTAGDPRRAALAARVAAVRASAVAPAPAPVDAETRARLASLGYVAGSPPPPEPGAVAADPKDRVALLRGLEEARAAIDRGEIAPAVARLAELVAADPQNPIFLTTLAEAKQRQGAAGDAIELYREAARRDPESARAWYDLATALADAGRSDEAVQALGEALRRDPGDPAAHNALGIALLRQGRADEARAAFAEATRLDARDPTAWNNLANVLRGLGRLDEAAAAYRQATVVAPTFPDAWNGLGTLEVQRGRPEVALPYFDRVIALAPDRHEARLNRAIALDVAGHTAEALVGYEAFLAATRDDPSYGEQRRAAEGLAARLRGASPRGTGR